MFIIRAIGKMLGGIFFQAAQDVIYNILYYGKKATWAKVLGNRSPGYVYLTSALSALIPGSKAARNAGRAGLNALASTFTSFAKNKQIMTRKNIPQYILQFFVYFGFNYMCERITRSMDVQLKNLNTSKMKKFAGNPLIKKGINNIRASHSIVSNRMKSYLSSHRYIITNWGSAIMQALNRKYGT